MLILLQWHVSLCIHLNMIHLMFTFLEDKLKAFSCFQCIYFFLLPPSQTFHVSVYELCSWSRAQLSEAIWFLLLFTGEMGRNSPLTMEEWILLLCFAAFPTFLPHFATVSYVQRERYKQKRERMMDILIQMIHRKWMSTKHCLHHDAFVSLNKQPKYFQHNTKWYYY